MSLITNDTSADGRQARRRREMRARLLAAALELFEQRGYAQTTIDEIAQRADVARQTVLNHFPHKRDFSIAWGERRRAQLSEIETAASPRASTATLLRRYFDALAEINERERVLTRNIHASVEPAEALLYLRPVPDAIVTTLIRGQQRGEVGSRVPPRVAAEVITAIYFDTLSRWVSQEAPLFSLSRALRERLELVLRGLLTET